MRELTLGSAFTGFGMFDYAAALAGIKTSWQIEINEFCQKLLGVRYPDAEKHKDIKETRGSSLGTVDIISGGDPCQPSSIAGKRGGKSDPRYLWEEKFRILCELKEENRHPSWVLNENVTGTISNAILDQKIIDLESIGYETQPFIIPAASVNADHKRDRVWLLANTNKDAIHYNTGEIQSKAKNIERKAQGKDRQWMWGKFGAALIEYLSFNTTGKGLQIPESEEFSKSLYDAERTDSQNDSHPDSMRPQRGGQKPYRKRQIGLYSREIGSWDKNWIEVAAQLCRVDVASSPRLLESRYRKQRLEGLGNGIQWEIAYIFFELIKQYENKA
jgi:site-specific DNA-cytosine methylase